MMPTKRLRNGKIRGVFVPLVTPLDAKGGLDKKGLEKLIRILEPKVDGLVPCLSTGEGKKLSESLWIEMLKTTLSFAEELPVMVGIEQPDTEQIIRRIRMVHGIGIEAIVVLPPFGKNIPQEEIYKHFARIAKQDVEILVYNKEMVCGTAIEIDTMLRILEIPDVVGVKEGSADPRFTQTILDSDSIPEISVMVAWETHITKNKVHGTIVPLANLEPEMCMGGLEIRNVEIQKRINRAVRRYHLEAENVTWYLDVKKELVKRGIIESARLV